MNPIVLRGKSALWATGLALGFSLASPLLAQGPKNTPLISGTIKSTAPVDLAPMFARQMELIESRRQDWLRKAEQATPALRRTAMQPVAIVKVEKHTASYQGWKAFATAKPESVCNRPMLPGDSFILDFGEHFTGQFIFSLRRFDIPVDAPVRLALVFGDVPAEVHGPHWQESGCQYRPGACGPPRICLLAPDRWPDDFGHSCTNRQMQNL
ncbi:MAG: hypothetical protein Q8N18_22325 [Opitutaceae bacterium]|nr:hypothetical protein [Opitutaceae bacterium]